MTEMDHEAVWDHGDANQLSNLDELAVGDASILKSYTRISATIF